MPLGHLQHNILIEGRRVVLEGFLSAISPVTLMVEIIGVIIGIIFGAIPGLTATLAIALFVPVTLMMSAENGMIMLGGIDAGAIFGGSINKDDKTMMNTGQAVIVIDIWTITERECSSAG